MQWVDLFGRGRLFQLVRKSLVAIGSYWWLSLTNDQVCVRCAPWERRCVVPTIDLHTKIPSTSLFCANLRCLTSWQYISLPTSLLPYFTPIWRAKKYGVKFFSKNLFCFVRFYLLLFHLWQAVDAGCQELKASIHDSISHRGRPHIVLHIQDRVLKKECQSQCAYQALVFTKIGFPTKAV